MAPSTVAAIASHAIPVTTAAIVPAATTSAPTRSALLSGIRRASRAFASDMAALRRVDEDRRPGADGERVRPADVEGERLRDPRSER